MSKPYNPQKHHRRSIRLKGYDYGQVNAYFVTINVYGRAPLFGEIVGGVMHLNEAGRVAEACWLAIPEHFPHTALDAYVIMPDHAHGIIWITKNVGAAERAANERAAEGSASDVEMRGGGVVGVRAKDFSPLLRQQPPSSQPSPSTLRSPSKTLGSIVRGFKIGVTKWMRANTDVHQVWQRNYYEHIVRSEADLARIRAYIRNNPVRWSLRHEDEVLQP